MNGIWALEPYDLGPWTLREWFGCVHSDFGLSDSEFEGFRTALLECFLFFYNELVCFFLTANGCRGFTTIFVASLQRLLLVSAVSFLQGFHCVTTSLLFTSLLELFERVFFVFFCYRVFVFHNCFAKMSHLHLLLFIFSASRLFSLLRSCPPHVVLIVCPVTVPCMYNFLF